MFPVLRFAALALALAQLTGCAAVLASDGGGQVDEPPTGPRQPDPRDIALPDGYEARVVATDLTFPTQVTFDDQGRVYVTESGYSYGEVFLPARLLRIESARRHVPIATSDNGPWTGVVFHDGGFYVAEGGVVEGGRILRITPEGDATVLVGDLPSFGDHHTNGPVIGPDGWLYFGQGTATNSAVVGPDNADFGWLARHPDFHDTPCEDVVLTGEGFTSENPLAPGEEDDEAVRTGAYVPFGTATEPGRVIAGRLPCNGAIMRIPPQGGRVELVAWGFRNPFGLAFAPDGSLYSSENGYDERGSRPVYGAPDVLWRVESGAWYGWPDYVAGEPVWTERYRPAGGAPAARLLAEHPGDPPQPVARLGVHSSSNSFDFSRNAEFGWEGQAFVAQFGDQAPTVGEVRDPVGFRVVRVDVDRGVTTTFAVNRAGGGPASKVGGHGLERPVAARFNPRGTALYVVDFGVLTMDERGAHPQKGTGVLWRISRRGEAR